MQPLLYFSLGYFKMQTLQPPSLLLGGIDEPRLISVLMSLRGFYEAIFVNARDL